MSGLGHHRLIPMDTVVIQGWIVGILGPLFIVYPASSASCARHRCVSGDRAVFGLQGPSQAEAWKSWAVCAQCQRQVAEGRAAGARCP